MHLQIKSVKYTDELTAIATIRRRVFQEEQGVAEELEFDGHDKTAQHLLAYLNGQPVGTARIRTLSKQRAKIERLAVLPQARGKGIGKKLMARAIESLNEKNYHEALVHAQEYIKELYQQLGFEQIGEPFTEADIAHVKMSKKLAPLTEF